MLKRIISVVAVLIMSLVISCQTFAACMVSEMNGGTFTTPDGEEVTPTVADHLIYFKKVNIADCESVVIRDDLIVGEQIVERALTCPSCGSASVIVTEEGTFFYPEVLQPCVHGGTGFDYYIPVGYIRNWDCHNCGYHTSNSEIIGLLFSHCDMDNEDLR